MTRVIRSRRAGPSLDQPMYARLLRLRHLAPSGFLCFVFLEGAIALGILLALAELVSWWGVLVLPALVALMVKLNDVVAGMLTGPSAATGSRGTRSGNIAAPARSGTPRSGTGSGSPRLRPAAVVTGFPAPDAADPAAKTRFPAPGAADAGGRWADVRPGFSAGDAEAARDTFAKDFTAENPGTNVERVPFDPRTWGPGAPAEAADADVLNGLPAARPWADQLDVRQQMSRQSASRRYE